MASDVLNMSFSGISPFDFSAFNLPVLFVWLVTGILASIIYKVTIKKGSNQSKIYEAAVIFGTILLFIITWTPLTLFWTFALKDVNIFQIAGYILLLATIYLNETSDEWKYFDKISIFLYILGILLVAHNFLLGLIGVKV